MEFISNFDITPSQEDILMNRRFFLIGIAALLGAHQLAFAGENTIDYSPGLIEEKLAAGETVFVDYSASWCGTCKRKERIIDELRANNPEFDKNISFVRVDWDTYASHEVSVFRNIPRRSTLILLRGEDELGRIVAGTNTGEIEALLKLGLADS